MTEKFVTYHRLLDALEKPGCPVCRCVLEDGRRHLDTLLYEQVTDAQTGAAILHEDLLRVCARRVDELRARRASRLARLLRRWQVTPARPRLVRQRVRRIRRPVCVAGREGEARYLDTAVEFIGDREFAAGAYARSTGLCLPHAVRAIEASSEGDGLHRLLDETLLRWSAVRRRLDGFVRKHEYRNTEPMSATEASACTTAFEILAGAAGVFGNDLHAGDGGK